MTPLVSVVIPTYHRPRQLALALNSVAAQRNLPGPVEVIVVNDGGIDVASPVEAACRGGLDVRLIDLPTNRGLPIARNTGIDAARGEFLALLDDDDVFLPDHLATMLSAIEHEDVDAAYGRCFISSTRVNPLAAPAFPPMPPFAFDADLLAVANYISVHTAVLRMPPPGARYDPALPALEDWDMWLRLVREHGYRFHAVGEVTVVYHRIPTDDSLCGGTVTEAAALARFGRLVQQLWARWPAPSERTHRFRLYIAVLYWNALAQLADGVRLADDYFQRCIEEIATVWHGGRSEYDLPERIVEALQERCVHVA
ncbi:glycosyltransferase family 2 protein [Nocardia sp. NPDC004068]|uniref:glycosyltransferase family 2 protein n=1 Tax=Nocardia sp. NPDC004068 TaxID=3364303 RepID=UPI0036761313